MATRAINEEISGPSDEQPIVAVLNTSAGSAVAAQESLASAGDFDVRPCTADVLEDTIRNAARSGARRILVAGGDGSVACAARALVGTDTELAILPGGTLNHFARDHHIPTDPAEAIRVALGDDSGRIDVGYADDTLFLNTLSVGVYVGYVRTRDRLETRVGYRIASILALLRTFVRMYTMRVELEVDGKIMRYRTALVFVGVGERELKAPKLGARVEGGRRGLHVMIVQGRRRARLVALGMAAAARGVDHATTFPELDSFVVERCTIHLRRRRAPIAVDGEIVYATSPLELRIEPDALEVVGAKCP